MTDNEILAAMKEMLQPIRNKLDDIDIKIDTMQLTQKTSERAIRKDIHFLNDEVDTLIAVMEAKGILPKVEGQ